MRFNKNWTISKAGGIFRKLTRDARYMTAGNIRIALTKSDDLTGEPSRLFDSRAAEGFWDRYVRPGTVVDIGYKGAFNSPPIFKDALGLDLDTRGYDGRNLPYPDSTIGTIHASHLLEHIADYGFFFRECLRVLVEDGTLILFLPLMDSYERKSTPPSVFNGEHKRFYTCARLLGEIESSLPRHAYRVIHVRERFRVADFSRSPELHAAGPYEIECVLEKTKPNGVY